MNYILLFVFILFTLSDSSEATPFNGLFKDIIKQSQLVTTLSLNATCISPADCNYHGHCIDGVCVCNSDWATFEATDESGMCNYERKSQLVAFLLQLFLGKISGAGYWYVGQVGLALAETLLFWVGMIFVCIMGCIGQGLGGDDGAAGCMYCFYVLWVLSWGLFWLISWIMFAVDDVLDGNGVALESW